MPMSWPCVCQVSAASMTMTLAPSSAAAHGSQAGDACARDNDVGASAKAVPVAMKAAPAPLRVAMRRKLRRSSAVFARVRPSG